MRRSGSGPGPPSSRSCDAGKDACAAKQAGCFLKEEGTAAGKGRAPDPAKLAKCASQLDSCVGKLEGKQSAGKPKTPCAVTGEATALAATVDAFVADAVHAVRNLP